MVVPGERDRGDAEDSRVAQADVEEGAPYKVLTTCACKPRPGLLYMCRIQE